ncbi:MAG: hypothetical protein RIG77_04730 [Cyclobacteriaceae bacterium]
MAQRFSNYPKFKLIKKSLNLKAIPYVSLNTNGGRKIKVELPDSAYGEWIIYQKNEPKFYFCAFKENGEVNRIASYAREKKMDMECFLVELLRTREYTDLATKFTGTLSIPLRQKSSMQEFELMQIVDS